MKDLPFGDFRIATSFGFGFSVSKTAHDSEADKPFSAKQSKTIEIRFVLK